MLHEIEPRVFHNQFQHKKATMEDLFLSYKGNSVLIREDTDKLWYPSFSDYSDSHPDLLEKAQFLFTIDNDNYFLVEERGLDTVSGWSYVSTDRFRSEKKYWRSFVGVVGWQLCRWYENHRFCGRCGKPLKRSDKERMLYCEDCGMTIYPNISPCVIVGVYDGDKLLLTKYANRAYSNYALVAGYVEIGESFEQTVQREVMEEVGLKVKNIRYYKSQPWPFTETMLAGFFAELDGDDTICLDKNELAVGVWLKREEIPEANSNISLTGEMIEAFRHGTFNKI
jgi:NAD+ diphosphatase